MDSEALEGVSVALGESYPKSRASETRKLFFGGPGVAGDHYECATQFMQALAAASQEVQVIKRPVLSPPPHDV